MTKTEKLMFMVVIPLLSATIPVLFGWQTLANLNGWIPKGECPNAPLGVSISSPGNGVTVPYTHYGKSYGLGSTTIVVEASRAINESYDIALLTKNSDDSQFHFKELYRAERVSPTRIRMSGIHIPISNTSSQTVEIRAVIVNDKKGFGEYYSSVEQVTSNKSFVSISEPITVKYRD